tara:strand:- start:75 stop:1049 length:975 start_codon:yes stop_codon:yes gene_type:complete
MYEDQRDNNAQLTFTSKDISHKNITKVELENYFNNYIKQTDELYSKLTSIVFLCKSYINIPTNPIELDIFERNIYKIVYKQLDNYVTEIYNYIKLLATKKNIFYKLPNESLEKIYKCLLDNYYSNIKLIIYPLIEKNQKNTFGIEFKNLNTDIMMYIITLLDKQLYIHNNKTIIPLVISGVKKMTFSGTEEEMDDVGEQLSTIGQNYYKKKLHLAIQKKLRMMSNNRLCTKVRNYHKKKFTFTRINNQHNNDIMPITYSNTDNLYDEHIMPLTYSHTDKNGLCFCNNLEIQDIKPSIYTRKKEISDYTDYTDYIYISKKILNIK